MRKIFKLSYEYVLFYLQILFIALFVLVLLAYNLDIAEKNFLERRMYSENVTGIQLGDGRVDKDSDVTVQIPEIANAEFMMYKNLNEGREIMRGIYGTGDVFGFSGYIGEGRFFGADDYANKTQTVVVGHNIAPRTFIEDGKRYLYYDRQMYEVIGVFKETGTDLDNTTYVNLTNIMETGSHIALYYIDAKDSGTVDRVLSELQKQADGKYGSWLLEYESPVVYIGLNRVNQTMLIFAVFAAVLNLLITAIFFVTHKKYKVAVQKLYGMTSRDLTANYGKSLMYIIISSFASVAAIIFGLSRYMGMFFTLDKLAAYHFCILGGLLVMLGVLVVLFIVRLAGRVNISDSLKGR